MTLALPRERSSAPRLPALRLPEGLGLPVLIGLVALLLGALPFLRLVLAALAPGGV